MAIATAFGAKDFAEDKATGLQVVHQFLAVNNNVFFRNRYGHFGSQGRCSKSHVIKVEVNKKCVIVLFNVTNITVCQPNNQII